MEAAGERTNAGPPARPAPPRNWLFASSLAEKRIPVGFCGGRPLLAFPLLQEAVSYAGEQAAATGNEVRSNLTTSVTETASLIPAGGCAAAQPRDASLRPERRAVPAPESTHPGRASVPGGRDP